MSSGKKLILLPELFKLLVEDCQQKVKQEYAHGEKISVRQLYGFGGNGDLDFTKPTMKKMIENDHRVLARSAGSIKVNIKHFYDKYREANKVDSRSPIVIESYHTWIYFEFLGFSALDDYLQDKRNKGVINEALFLKQIATGGKRNEHEKGEGRFLCYHYSRLWNGIFSFELILDFDSIEFEDHFPVYNVTSVSGILNSPQAPVPSFGKAIHKRGNLIVEIEDHRGGMQKMIFSIQPSPDNIQADTVFLGSYVGISQNTDIISGTICLVKKDTVNQEIPLQVERYLFLDKWQKRIQLEPLGYQIDALPLYRDREELLDGFFGNYRFCWLDSEGKRLIESQLTIHENYEFQIRTFMSKSGLYSGRIFVRDNVVCLNSVGLRERMSGINLSASVFFDIRHIPKRKPKKWIKGVYILAGVTSFPKFGFCIIEKIDNDQLLEPSIHEEKDILKCSHRQKAFLKLREMLSKEYKFSLESDPQQEGISKGAEESS